MGTESNSGRQFHRAGSLLPIVAICLSLAATQAQGMGMCGQRGDFVKALNDKYQESRKSIGIAGEVNVVELFTSKTGTWTILVTTPEGKSCIIGAGKGWENLETETLGTDT